MKKGFFVVLLSVLLSGLTAYGVVKANNEGVFVSSPIWQIPIIRISHMRQNLQ